MNPSRRIEIISAPSILGLKPTGVQDLAYSLLSSGLAEYLHPESPIINVPTLNALYDDRKDPETNCLNARPIRDFSLSLNKVVSGTLNGDHFAFVQWGATLGRPIFRWHLLSWTLFDRDFFKRSILSGDILFWNVHGRNMVLRPVPHRPLH